MPHTIHASDSLSNQVRIAASAEADVDAALRFTIDGDIVNVSAWQDSDKEGGHYKDYFPNASSYTITNWRTEARGYQGTPGEIFLDLTEKLPVELGRRFDVVFNHTTLEHVFDFQTAFSNLCGMSRDLVVVVVPLVQQVHADYGDFWRFTPQAVEELFGRNGLGCVYIRTNDHLRSSVYVFAVGSRQPGSWAGSFGEVHVPGRKTWLDGFRASPGSRSIVDPLPVRIAQELRRRTPSQDE